MAFGALSSGISALRSFSKGMEVIGNNIANVNTVSFKGSRIKYSETFNQVLQQSAPSPADGKGSNVQASQVGLGVQVEGIVGQFHQGGLSATNQLTDLAISGEGFFLVKDSRNNDASYATRGGDFRIDDRGYLVTSSGMNVQGLFDGSIGFEVDVNADGEWTFKKNQDTLGGTISATKPGAIQIDYNKGLAEVVDESYADPNRTRNAVMFTNDLVSRDVNGAPVLGSIAHTGGVIDSYVYGASDVGKHRVGDFVLNEDRTAVTAVSGWHTFMEEAVNNLTYLRNIGAQGPDNSIVTDTQIQQAVSSDFFHAMFADEIAAHNAVPGNPQIAVTGSAVRDLFITSGSIDWDSTIDSEAIVSSVESTFPTDLIGAERLIQSVRADKTPDLSRFSIDGEGTLTYFLSNGESFQRGKIMLVDFNDKTALIREGQNLYSGFGAAGVKDKTNDNPDGLQTAGRNGLGQIRQGALELSNVDLTNEFAQMITTQRGFQAGSRIITVSDEILQEVVNLKR